MAAELPPHRPNINHIFTLEKGENGQKKTRHKALYMK